MVFILSSSVGLSVVGLGLGVVVFSTKVVPDTSGALVLDLAKMFMGALENT